MAYTFARKMNWPPDPKSWSEFPGECFWYLLPGVVFHIVALVISSVGIMTLRMMSTYQPRFSTAIIFQGYLLIAAMIANGVWSCVVWGRLYWSVDYTSDFSIFMPILRTQVEGSWGPNYSSGLNGVSLTELNLVWLMFAVVAWLIALAASRWTTSSLRKRIGDKTLHPTVDNVLL